MKIAIVTPTLPPYASGIGNVAAHHARQLTKLGYQVKLFTPEYEKIDQEEVTEVSVRRVPPMFKHGNAAFVPALSWMLEGYDIIHLHYPFFGGSETIWLHKRKYKKKFGTKIVLHYHMDVVGAGLKHLIFSLHKLFFLSKLIKMADSVIVTSQDYAKHSNIAKYLKKSPDKFLEVPNGVDTLHFQPQPKDQALMENYNISPEDKVIVFVGGLDKAHYFKGIEYLLQAVTRLRRTAYSWKLLIIGEGDLRPTYESMASQLNIVARVMFSGYVANADLPRYYNLADVVVLPSVDKSEAFGMALAEGMACGKPCIATNLPGVRTVIDDQVNGLVVEPRNVKDLANKINHLLDNPNLAAEYGLNGERKARRRYDWKQIGYQLDGLYRGLREK